MKRRQISHRSLCNLTHCVVAFFLLLTSAISANAVSPTVTLLGTNAGISIGTGTDDTAIGNSALQLDTSGSFNTAVGSLALTKNVTATYNAAVGYGALQFNTANYNSALGGLALNVNTSGTSNVAVGFASMDRNTTGSLNTALGYGALYFNTTGASNVANGNQALFNSVTGSFNVAVGDGALLNSKGSGNIGIGDDGGYNLTTGSNNIYIGNPGGTPGGGTATESGIIRIGYTKNGAGGVAYGYVSRGVIHGNGSGLTGVTVGPGSITGAQLAPSLTLGGNGADFGLIVNAAGGLGAVFADGGTNGYGVEGKTTNAVGVWGLSSGTGFGVQGDSMGGDGVHGISQSGSGVYGRSNTGIGVFGDSAKYIGVYGKSVSPDVAGVQGVNTLVSGGIGYGVIGTAVSGSGVGVQGNGTLRGVMGTGTLVGVYGSAPGSVGVEGHGSTAVQALGTNIGIYASASASGGVAGSFDGDLVITGMLNQNFLTVRGGANEQAYLGGDGLGNDIQIGSTNASVTEVYCFNATTQKTMNLHVKTLTITGGADFAEPFPMSHGDLAPGSVVVIDAEHPGELKISRKAYDTHVAGIVSGANGVNPGVVLHQEGAIEGDQNVALSGRVYVLADASNCPIKPGDLLTTGETPGHAMKATDHDRTQGAVIGKAMSSLDEGTGMVLVLVTLQ